MKQEVIQFFQSFLDHEYQLTMAKVDENLDSVEFQEKTAMFGRFFGCDNLKPSVMQLKRSNNSNFDNIREQVKENAPCKIFLIRRYQSTDYGDMYCCYVSIDWQEWRGYFFNYFAKYINHDLKIFSRYIINREYDRWNWNGDVKIKTLGTFLEIQRFLEPSDDRDVDDFRSDEGIMKFNNNISETR